MKIITKVVLFLRGAVLFAGYISLLAATEKILVNIDRVVKEVDENTSCKLDDWTNNLDAACKCCLVKRVPLLDTGKKASEIVKECIAKGYCTKPIFEHIQKEEHELGTSEQELEKTLRKLYNNSLVIKKVDTEGIKFDQYGNFTESSVGPFLERAFQEGKLPNEAFKSASCLKVTNLIEAKGTRTAQLFTIESTCKGKSEYYILKETSAKYVETKRLADLYGIKALDDLIWPHTQHGYPSLAIPEAFIQYGDHYLSLMPQAPGAPLSSFMKKYVINPTEENKQLVIQAYNDVGYAIAKFHRKFMKQTNNMLGPTVIHGDFQHQNIFYDPKTKQVTLIDNELIAKGFANLTDPVKDIVHLLIISIDVDILIPQEIRNSLNPQKWLEIVVPAFLMGYLKAYPAQDRKKVLKEIQDHLKNNALYKEINGKTKYPLDNVFTEIEHNLQ
ncbi:MAG: hypothetical protein WA432_02100 [Candidatus Babeliaceae bacterium]